MNTPPESVSELADDVAFALLGSVLVLELLELELLSAFVALRLVFCFAFGFGTLLGFAVLLLWDTPPDPAAPELRVARAVAAGLLRVGMALGTSSHGERYSKSESPSNSICPSAWVSIAHLNSGVCC